ncbi:TauD/TfdA dioxygenase family protein [Kluyveromyces lactis]|uniref:KLLA0E14433p n=1 Tax=Kluyveromyces lactis (strain ATCC 8585 / CBS 2359 / DSM 70799 / NBRC 1267 / NRRL Y-1140 / WM37) TaxID=284590 RepID=Q6CN89_KLULA|nr:uncharacterized protein KLLA0_E14433g [Kluyveromyces lactis]CAG99687.1 KLLA0E14433p [Kluyveromyces lactis]|eukprot:XP_454600.1 uncharacterized protein KLLA0_E14433g [Kluyveromyces lactis]
MPVSTLESWRANKGIITAELNADDDGVVRTSAKEKKQAKYKDYLPSWDPNEKFPPHSFVKYEDPALKANPKFPHLLTSGVEISPITPKLGSEIRGLQLSELDNAGKDELALLTAERGVLIFRDQDFVDRGPGYIEEYGKYFGELHVHHASPAPEGHPYIHVVYKNVKTEDYDKFFEQTLTSVYFHTDITFELQPSGYTFFAVLDAPQSGGDTLFGDAIEIFDRLSPSLQEYLSGLHAVHALPPNGDAFSPDPTKRISRHEIYDVIHPVVRVHPVLKKKVLNINKVFTRKIVELKKPESDALLAFLYQVIDNAHDAQVRANWKPGTVVVWDNRRLYHAGVYDFDASESTRHHVRVTPLAERPVEDLKYLNDPNYYPIGSKPGK